VLAVPCLAVISALSASGGAAAAPPATAHGATRTPIKHFVTLMQENHSFDNYFGTYPGADGVPANVCMPVSQVPDGRCVRPYHITDRSVEGLAYSAALYRDQFADGAMNGFASAYTRLGVDGAVAMGHYDARDIPFYWNVARDYVLFDRFFASATSGSVRNHMYWISGSPGNRDADAIPTGGFDAPTIFDRLDAAGVSWKFYIENYDPAITLRNRPPGDRDTQVTWAPLLAYARYLDDPAFMRHVVPLSEYYDDLAQDRLPAVSYIVPSASSEHPPSSVRAGETFVRSLVTSLMRSRAWSTSAFMWTYDSWGGWYDHVQPPRVDQFGLGFRVPALLVSPFARRGYVDSTSLEFSSVLRFIEHNWRLQPLTGRDAGAGSMLAAFDFRHARAPVFVRGGQPVTAVSHGRRSVVYIAYGAALVLPLICILGAVLTSRRRRPLVPL
jgi:phospholipase C